MNRRRFIENSSAFGLAIAASAGQILAEPPMPIVRKIASPVALHLEPGAKIPAAFLLSDHTVLIDFAGPWEVLKHVKVRGRDDNPFEPYTVSETRDPIHAGGQIEVIPNYTLENAPRPKLVIIPAQRGESPAMIDWIRHSSKSADVTMSVCVGAFLLAKTGLLSGKKVTTHHSSLDDLARQYPDLHVIRGVRFVDEGNLATAGGLSCGIDLMLHIVERYFGREVAAYAAEVLEYQGLGWMSAGPIHSDSVPVGAHP